MTVHLEIPDDLITSILSPGQEPSRLLFELTVAEAYKKGLLGKEYTASLLGYETEDELNAFFDRHEIYNLTVEEFEEELATMQKFLDARAKDIAA